MILTPLQKLPKSVGDLGKLIVAKGFEKLPKVHEIAQSDHTECDHNSKYIFSLSQRETINLEIETIICSRISLLMKTTFCWVKSTSSSSE